ncbi:MAG: magnesium transporter [Thermoanaerobaculia bacterium]
MAEEEIEEREAEREERIARLSGMVHERHFVQLRQELLRMDPPNIADVVQALELEDEVIVFRLLSREVAARTFEYLSFDAQEELLKGLGDKDITSILNDMSPDDRTALLEELPAKVTKRLLNLLSPDERTVASRLLGYPEDSIGRLMTPDYVAVREEWKVEEVLAHVRVFGRDSETLNVIYVVDDDGTLIDDIRMREFLLVPPDSHVDDLMDHQFVALQATDDQETAIALFRKHDRTALPVTDTGGALVGIVTVDDVLDVVEEEATEDIQKLGGSEALDEPYLTIALPRMIKKRATWLVFLLVGEMLTATAMGYFEKEIARAVVLALFIPMIISAGGNTGSQAATLVTRALALGELRIRDWWYVLGRECISGLGLGLILGIVGFARVTVWAVAFNLYGPHWLPVAATIGCALVGVVLWGSIAGSMLPIVLKSLGADPAASSAPFVATLVDVTGIVIYFTVAATILRGILL